MKVHHVGYLVADMDSAIVEFVNMGFEVRRDKIYDSARHVYLCFMENNGVMIELVSPAEDCKLFTSLQKRIGNAPYHICYFPEGVDAFGEAISTLEEQGFIMVQPPEAAVAFEGRRVAFLMSPEIGLIEVLEAEKVEEGIDKMEKAAIIDQTRPDQTRPELCS